MKLTIIILSFLFYFQNLSKGNQNVWPWNALLNVNQRKVPIYSSCDKKAIRYHIMNDTLKEDYLELKIVAKRNNLFKIKFASVRNEKMIREGWIESKYVGTYLRSRIPQDVYPIYIKPIEGSSFFNVKNVTNETVDILDITANWVKVRMIIKGKTIVGWLPAKYTCPDPYASCT